MSFLVRSEQLRRRQFEGDLDLAIVAEAVGVAAIDASMREPNFRERYRSIDNVVGVERQRGVTAFSISEATGIPRETARRKLKRLLELGVLVEKCRSQYVLKPGYVQTPAMRAMFDELTSASLRFFNDCFDQHVWEVVGNQQSRD